jgi:hypothetical protein
VQVLAAAPDGWPVLALLAACGAAAQVLEARTALGRLLSAPTLALGTGLGLAAGGLLPQDCDTYSAVWQGVMPLAASLYMLEADFEQ